MRGDLCKEVDVYAHNLRVWGKEYADNAAKKARRNASKARTGRFVRLLWLSTSQGKKAQGTYLK